MNDVVTLGFRYLLHNFFDIIKFIVVRARNVMWSSVLTKGKLCRNHASLFLNPITAKLKFLSASAQTRCINVTHNHVLNLLFTESIRVELSATYPPHTPKNIKGHSRLCCPKPLRKKNLGDRIRTCYPLHPMQVFSCFKPYHPVSFCATKFLITLSNFLICINILSYLDAS